MTEVLSPATTPPRTGDDPPAARERRRLVVRGVVQGVGFRPFIWSVAERLDINGFVCNTSGAVVIEAEGDPDALDALGLAIRERPPRLSRVTSVEVTPLSVRGMAGFVIEASRAIAGQYQPISPDAATCDDCVRELLDPRDRRHGYAFINCTNCGPRFTIIEDIPYDRPLTTMRHFAMCAVCRREYEDPTDRRFHAQPVCCSACGPRLWFTGTSGCEIAGDPIALAAGAILDGAIVAIKGLGGFQLACDAGDAAVVGRLRDRKHRPAKPLAVMVPDDTWARRLCMVSEAEMAILAGTARPIVLLRRHHHADDAVAAAIAPGLVELGMMLPYTPLHHLLLRALGRPLVMTSGNLSEDPIAKANDEALTRLGGVADAFLLHDREIHARYDDSVVRIVAGREQLVRRARGYCPHPVPIATDGVEILSVGGHLKNTFCILKDGRGFIGPHIGDLDHPLARSHQEESLATYLRLFRARPSVVASDLHPDYASTGLAERWWQEGAARVQVQHHHAHVASVMAEHGLRGRILGVAFDGLGYGPDATIWGGELLLCDERSYQRVGHIAPVLQPGGDRCAREGWRMAIAYHVAGGGDEPLAPPPGVDASRWEKVARVAAGSALAPISTSAGRLFDAVASLLGIAHHSTYEAEAAIRLQALATTLEPGAAGHHPVALAGSPMVLDTVGLVRRIATEARAGRPAAELAAVFHESLARAVADALSRLALEHGVHRAALSGGVFQNTLLLERLEFLLRERELDVYVNWDVPANDGGISLGQALVAAAVTGRSAS